ncbi:beta-ketoacyl-ACP synthase II [Haploplasma axanthum]|uniref:3-oxoacyl-[acyl-carrier-protein] synthase 2 n=1 Tax=Haploplasma axanthum TaxID=29552 RepID=A0A449BEW1_HAPAX|nr:beta-ketoacyl-ACP synthase II [Haploplasma axanthum]VEU80977.1 3-oxoacyl-[acyl-carrier-protein] synthase 2 [Haploplasma axanthum]
MKRRVVITGQGAVTPVGNNVNEMFENMIKGKNGIDYIKSFDTTDFKVKIAGEIKDLDFSEHFDHQEIRKNDRVILLALLAAKEAFEGSKVSESEYDPYRFGVYVTSGIGGINTLFEQAQIGLVKGFSRISPYFTTNTIINMPGAVISIKYGLKGPVVPIVTACSASNNAIGEAYRSIKDGYLDLALAGGVESSLNKLGLSSFASLRALSSSEDINRSSIPFDKERSGFVMSEGVGIVLLEEYEHAKKRGANILAEVVGYGTTSDAYHITAPDSEAEGISRAILDALKDANIEPKDIGYVNAHGTSTKLNDQTETLAIKKTFKDYANKVSISSTKSMTGHMLGATGGVESIVCIEALRKGLIPPTINYQVVDEECDLNYTPNKFVKKDIKYALNMNLGFGGHNGVLIFKKMED